MPQKENDYDWFVRECLSRNYSLSELGPYLIIQTTGDCWGLEIDHLYQRPNKKSKTYYLYHLNAYGRNTWHKQGKGRKYTREAALREIDKHKNKLNGYLRNVILLDNQQNRAQSH